MWRFTLNGNEIEDPRGWERATIEVERLEDIKGVLYSYITGLTFHGYGYTLLLNEFNNNNYCTPVEVLIEEFCDEEDGYSTFFEGYIYLTECDYDLEQCTVQTRIVDQTYIGKIEANRNIKADVNVGRSKNDTSITPATTHNIYFFTPCTGVNLGTGVKCWTVHDCFKMMVEFITDGEMTFSSPLFDVGGKYEGWMLTTGLAVRDRGNFAAPRISFKELFEEINKKTNISFYIDESGAIPTIVVAETEDVYESATVHTLDRIRNIEMRLDIRHIYSLVELGSRINQEDDGGCGLGGFAHPDGRFFGHKEESYHMLGDCNVDNDLDLVSDWIIDSNVIEDIVINLNEDHDDEVIIIETDYPAGTNFCIKGDLFDPTARTYNPGITNQATLENYFGSVPQQIATFLGVADDEFKATIGADQPRTTGLSYGTPAAFPNEVHDVGLNYDNALYEYVAPAGGAYYFETEAHILNTQRGPELEAGDLAVTFVIQVDRGGGYVVEINKVVKIPWDNLNFFLNKALLPYTLYLDTGDKVRVFSIGVVNDGPGPGTSSFILAKDTRFECVQAVNGGGIYQTFEPEDVRLVLYEFDYPLSNTDFNTILSGNRQKIALNDGRDFSDVGWLDRLTYSVQTGVGKWIIRAKNDFRP